MIQRKRLRKTIRTLALTTAVICILNACENEAAGKTAMTSYAKEHISSDIDVKGAVETPINQQEPESGDITLSDKSVEKLKDVISRDIQKELQTFDFNSTRIDTEALKSELEEAIKHDIENIKIEYTNTESEETHKEPLKQAVLSSAQSPELTEQVLSNIAQSVTEPVVKDVAGLKTTVTNENTAIGRLNTELADLKKDGTKNTDDLEEDVTKLRKELKKAKDKNQNAAYSTGEIILDIQNDITALQNTSVTLSAMAEETNRIDTQLGGMLASKDFDDFKKSYSKYVDSVSSQIKDAGNVIDGIKADALDAESEITDNTNMIQALGAQLTVLSEELDASNTRIDGIAGQSIEEMKDTVSTQIRQNPSLSTSQKNMLINAVANADVSNSASITDIKNILSDVVVESGNVYSDLVDGVYFNGKTPEDTHEYKQMLIECAESGTLRLSGDQIKTFTEYVRAINDNATLDEASLALRNNILDEQNLLLAAIDGFGDTINSINTRLVALQETQENNHRTVIKLCNDNLDKIESELTNTKETLSGNLLELDKSTAMKLVEVRNNITEVEAKVNEKIGSESTKLKTDIETLSGQLSSDTKTLSDKLNSEIENVNKNIEAATAKADKELSDSITGLQDTINLTTSTQADINSMISGQISSGSNAYNPDSTYKVNDVVMYDNQFYICVIEVSTPEPFNPVKWSATSISGILNAYAANHSDLSGTVAQNKESGENADKALSESVESLRTSQETALEQTKTDLESQINTVFGSIRRGADIYSETANYKVKDIVIYDNALYRCTSATSGEFDENAWQPVSIAGLINALNNGDTEILNLIEEYKTNQETVNSGIIDQINKKDDAQTNSLKETKEGLESQLSALDEKQTETDSRIGKSSDEYSSGKTYDIGDLVLHDNKMFKCIEKIETPEEFNESKWTQTTITEAINEKFRFVTQEEYDALQGSGSLNPSTYYFISE